MVLLGMVAFVYSSSPRGAETGGSGVQGQKQNHNKIATVLMSVSYYKAIQLDLKAAFPPGTLSLVPHSVKVVNRSASKLKGKKIP